MVQTRTVLTGCGDSMCVSFTTERAFGLDFCRRLGMAVLMIELLCKEVQALDCEG